MKYRIADHYALEWEARDCRRCSNLENQKSSRKNIPRSKQRSHQGERRTVRQALIAAQGVVADEVADEAQSQALRKDRMKRLKGFEVTG